MKPQLAADLLNLMEGEDLTYYDAMDTLCWLGAKVKEQWEKNAQEMDFSPIAREVKNRALAIPNRHSAKD